jgi:predicted transcriptional regulator
MSTTPFSMRIDTDIKARLERRAELEDRSAGYIVQKAVSEYLDAKDYMIKCFREAEVEADKGIFISEQAMDVWVRSWDTDDELPPPEPDVFPAKEKA